MNPQLFLSEITLFFAYHIPSKVKTFEKFMMRVHLQTNGTSSDRDCFAPVRAQAIAAVRQQNFKSA